MWATLYFLDIINSDLSEDIWIPAVKITSTKLKLFRGRVQTSSGKSITHERTIRLLLYLLTNLKQVELVNAFFNIHLAIFFATIFDFLIAIKIIKRYIFNWLTMNFLCFYLNHNKCRGPLIFQTLNTIRSNSLSFKY